MPPGGIDLAIPSCYTYFIRRQNPNTAGGSLIETIQKILIVDDEPDFLNSLRRYLKREPFVIQSAGNGDEAKHLILEAAADNATFDLVITDLIMPKVDGWQLVQWIQENQPRIATITLTGLGENGLGHLQLRPNMDLRSIKTLTPQQLLELIHQLDKTLRTMPGWMRSGLASGKGKKDETAVSRGGRGAVANPPGPGPGGAPWGVCLGFPPHQRIRGDETDPAGGWRSPQKKTPESCGGDDPIDKQGDRKWSGKEP